MKDIRQTSNYAEYLARIGWHVVENKNEYIYIKKIPILGSLVKLQRFQKTSLLELERIAKENRAYQIIVEPLNNEKAEILKAKEYKSCKNPSLITKTIQINLDKDISAIYEDMEKRTRRDIRHTKDIAVYDIDSVEEFYSAWAKTIGYKDTILPIENLHALKHSFKENCSILITPNASSGAIILYAEGIGYYWYAFSSQQGREERAQYKVLWSGINWAKKRGARLFDMEGIYDRRFPIKSWKGFSMFKRGFGGKTIEFPGAFSKKRIPI